MQGNPHIFQPIEEGKNFTQAFRVFEESKKMGKIYAIIMKIKVENSDK